MTIVTVNGLPDVGQELCYRPIGETGSGLCVDVDASPNQYSQSDNDGDCPRHIPFPPGFLRCPQPTGMRLPLLALGCQVQMSTGPTSLTRRGREIVDRLYRCGRLTARRVMEELSDQTTYSTVRTELSVLEAKGSVANTENLHLLQAFDSY